MSSPADRPPTALEAELGLGVPPDRLTLGAFMADIVARYGDHEAMVTGAQRWTYRQLGAQTRRVAKALIAGGVTKGTRVGVLMGNRPELAATIFAAGSLGAVVVPMSTFAVAPERYHVMAHSDMALMVVQDRLAQNAYLEDLARDHREVTSAPPGNVRSTVFPNLRRVVAFGQAVGGVQTWDDFLGSGADVTDELLEAVGAAVVPYDDAVMIYTSGTTALPKSVLHTHRSVTGQLWRWGGQLGLTTDDRVWSAFPFFWSAGFAMVLGGSLSCGATLYVDEVFDPPAVLELIERERITTYNAFPHTDAQLADHPDARRRDLTSLVNIRSASALYRFTGRVPDESSWDVSAGYGSSETFTVSTALPNDAPLSLRLSSHGLPLPGMRIRIVDTETGAVLGAGETGEITVKGVYLIRAYYKAAPEDTLDEEGWFHTGDAGHLDEAGYLHWGGRISGMIKTGGSNVSPVEVETRAIESKVLGVVTVVGVPHHLLGEAVVMCAVPLEGTEPDPAAVLAHLRATLASYKVPRRILFFNDEELRFTASEKVQVDDVRRLAAERLVAADGDLEWVEHLKNVLAEGVPVKGTAGREPVIVGIGTSDLPVAPHLDTVGHHVLATQCALADAGLEKSAIDGYCCAGGSKEVSSADDMGVMVEYLGLAPRFTDGTMTGGSSFELHVEHAAAALRTGLCDTVLVTYGSDQLSRMGRQLGTKGFFGGQSKVRGPAQYEAPYGATIVASYAMAAMRHMHEFGTTPEQLASVAVAARAHAAANPEALYREPLTVDDVLSSPMVADPLHRLDCCVISDGGGALVLTTAERAADLPQAPVAVLSAASAQTHWNISSMGDFTTTAALGAGRDLFAHAGLSPSDVDVLECYDSFTITVLLLLEDLGFCEKGTGGAFAESGAIAPGGSLPVNTDGGGLSAVHPGIRGIFLVIEAVRQLRGTSRNQVPDCEVALACGVGGLLSCIGAVLLGRTS